MSAFGVLSGSKIIGGAPSGNQYTYSLAGGNVFDYNNAGGTATVTITLATNGTITYTLANGGAVTTGDWLNPANTTEAALFQVKFTETTGTISSGSATGAYLSCGTARSWTITKVGAGSKVCNATIDIQRISTSTSVLQSLYSFAAIVTADGSPPSGGVGIDPPYRTLEP